MNDLLVGDGDGYVRIFLNTNSNEDPALDGGSLVQVYGLPPNSRMVGARATPVMEDWNGDGIKDLLIGNLDGNILVYLNVGTAYAPAFNSTYFTNSTYLLKVGGINYDIGSRAAPRVFDWNNDGLKDLLVGEYSGYVYFLQNVGTNSAPVFNSAQKLALRDGTTIRYPDVPSGTPRSRIYATDWNDNGLIDLIVGGKDGKLLLFLSECPDPELLFDDIYDAVNSGVAQRTIRLRLFSMLDRSESYLPGLLDGSNIALNKATRYIEEFKMYVNRYVKARNISSETGADLLELADELIFSFTCEDTYQP